MNAWKMICVSLTATMACGGGGAKATTPVGSGAGPATTSQGTAVTEAQVKLGHFVTADGMHGFVLDRTGAAPRLQIDGEPAIIELTMEEDRGHGELEGYKLVDPAGAQRLYISTGGRLLFYKNGDALPASFDKDVAPLGTPTVAGKPVKEKARHELRAEALAPLTVRAKFPQFTAADSANLAKVAEAFDKADAAMFVHFKRPGSDGWQARLTVTPDAISGIGYGRQEHVTDADEAKRHAKLARHGGVIAGYSSPDSAQGNHIIVTRADTARDALADGTPGLLWEIDSTTAVFVALDGGRYHVDLGQEAETIVKGAGPEATWPKPVADTYVDLTMISALAKAGAGGDATVAELEKIDGAWNACVVKGWKAAQAKIDTGKLSVGQVKAEIKKLHKGCNKQLDAFERTIVKYAEDRAKARHALFVKAAARAKTAP